MIIFAFTKAKYLMFNSGVINATTLAIYSDLSTSCIVKPSNEPHNEKGPDTIFE